MNRRVGDELERLSVLVVTDNFFEGLGIRPRLGRTFSAGEAAPERAPRAIVLDHPYWNARFGADPNAIGQTMILDGEPFTVDRRAAGGLPIGHRLHGAECVRAGQRADAADLERSRKSRR